jgi:hypothetical protein
LSKNFELLRYADKEAELLRTSGAAEIAASNGTRPKTSVERLLREEENKLVSRVFLLPGSDGPRVVLFCGVDYSDGAGYVCARASEILTSRTGASVCMVEANSSWPFLHQHFGLDKLLGVSDPLVQSGPIPSFAQRVANSNLWILPFGCGAAGRQSLLASDRLQSRIGELRAEFDYVLINAPPMSFCVETISLGQVSDGAILVIKSESTHREAARTAKGNLESAKVRVLGAVLNDRKFPIPESLYRKL